MAGGEDETPIPWRVAAFPFPDWFILEKNNLNLRGRKRFFLSRGFAALSEEVWHSPPVLLFGTEKNNLAITEKIICAVWLVSTPDVLTYIHISPTLSPAKSVHSCYFCSQNQSYLKELLAGWLHYGSHHLPLEACCCSHWSEGITVLIVFRESQKRLLENLLLLCYIPTHFHLLQPMISISFSCCYHKALQPFTDQLWVLIPCEVDYNGKQFLK